MDVGVECVGRSMEEGRECENVYILFILVTLNKVVMCFVCIYTHAL